MFAATLLLAVAPTADGKLLFVAHGSPDAKGGPGCVFVWDLEKAALRDVIPGTPANAVRVQPTADGKRFVLVTGEGAYTSGAAVYDTAAGKKLHALDGLPRWSSAAVSPDGKWFAARSPGREPELRVWDCPTGKRAEEVEKAVAARAGSVAFTADGKLAIASLSAFATFDPATGKTVTEWKRDRPVPPGLREDVGEVAVLPDGKGFVSVAGDGKRRQRYVVRLVTEKKEWFLRGLWDRASGPLVSPGGLLLVSGSEQSGEDATLTLKLGADGAPEPAPGGEIARGPAWQPWALAEPDRAGRTRLGALAFAPDGKRLFVATAAGVRVFDVDRREQAATLFAAAPAKGEPPAWHIVTAAGAFVASPDEAAALEKAGKARDAAKVKAALGVK